MNHLRGFPFEPFPEINDIQPCGDGPGGSPSPG